MHKTRIIGVSGQLGSGKDTVADHLIRDHGFVRIALADPIKRFGYHVFLFSEKQLWGPSQFRNEEDARYTPGNTAWVDAQARMESYGREYCQALNIPDVESAYKALVHWFFWLKTDHPHLSPRVMLQTMGTEWGREAVSDNIWISALLAQAKTLLHEDGSTKEWSYDQLHGPVATVAHPGQRPAGPKAKPIRGVVISDVRFPNEFVAIRNEGGSVIRVIRPDTDADAATVGIAGHASEAHEFALDSFDFIVQNEHGLRELNKTVDMFMLIFNATHH